MKRVVLTGNGLSVALNKEFSLEGITKRFFDRLTEEHRTFIEHHMQNKYNQRDFEEAILIQMVTVKSIGMPRCCKPMLP